MYQELIQLLEMPNELIYPYLKGRYFSDYLTDAEGMYFYQNNDSPILLVAHMDTVKIDKIEVVQTRKVLTNKFNEPLGADDRAGVYAIIRILRECESRGIQKPSVLICHEEECGGQGVKKFMRDNVLVKDSLRLLIEFDRRGSTEYVEYKTLEDEVMDYVESFGYDKKFGSYSDIADISRDTMIPGVNLSVGYYNQHRGNERLHLDELELTITRALAMLEDPIDQLYPCRETYVYQGGAYGGRGAAGFQGGFHGGGDTYDDDYCWPHGGGYGYGHSQGGHAAAGGGKKKGGTGNKQAQKNGKKKNKGNKVTNISDHAKASMSKATIDAEVQALLEHVPNARVSYIDSELNALISQKCWMRRCRLCGELWMDCDCGEIIHMIVMEFTDEELWIIYENCLLDGEFIKESMADYLTQDGEEEEPTGSDDTTTH